MIPVGQWRLARRARLVNWLHPLAEPAVSDSVLASPAQSIRGIAAVYAGLSLDPPFRFSVSGIEPVGGPADRRERVV